MNPVGWFEIPVNDLDRVRTFYESVFGFQMSPQQPMGEYDMVFFPMEQGVPGAAGTLMKGMGYTPSRTGTVVYFQVEDIAATLAKIERAGGKTIFPKKSIGQYGFIAWFEDCEGNSVALHSMK